MMLFTCSMSVRLILRKFYCSQKICTLITNAQISLCAFTICASYEYMCANLVCAYFITITAKAVTTGYAKVRGALGPPCFDVTEGPPTSHIAYWKMVFYEIKLFLCVY